MCSQETRTDNSHPLIESNRTLRMRHAKGQREPPMVMCNNWERLTHALCALPQMMTNMMFNRPDQARLGQGVHFRQQHCVHIIVIAIMLCICMGKVGIAVGAQESPKWVQELELEVISKRGAGAGTGHLATGKSNRGKTHLIDIQWTLECEFKCKCCCATVAAAKCNPSAKEPLR